MEEGDTVRGERKTERERTKEKEREREREKVRNLWNVKKKCLALSASMEKSIIFHIC